MKLHVYFKHMPKSPATCAYAEQKIGERLEKYNFKAQEAHLTFAVENGAFIVKCHIMAAHGVDFVVTSEDLVGMSPAIDSLADKLDTTLRRKKEKLQSIRGPSLSDAGIEELASTLVDSDDAIDAADVLQFEKTHPISDRQAHRLDGIS